jgi:hypothetical protein
MKVRQLRLAAKRGDIAFHREMTRVNRAYVIKVGDIYEDCNYHPVRCTYVNAYYGDIEGVSMIDGSSPRSCSTRYCGVVKLSEQQAAERVEAYKQHGERGLMRLRGWPDAAIDEFLTVWRAPASVDDQLE